MNCSSGSLSSKTRTRSKYIDKSKINNINEEIDNLSQLIMKVQEKNEEYKKKLLENKEQKVIYKSIEDNFDYNFLEKGDKSKKLSQIRLTLKNTAFHIFKLQLIQFSECIKRIYKNKKTLEYFITFDNIDSSENMPPVVLNEKDYKHLISFREKYLNNEIFSSFILKENCCNPNLLIKSMKSKSLISKRKVNSQSVGINHYIKNYSSYPNISNFSKKEKINIGEFCLSSYNICHQCKLQKISEDLVKCQNGNHLNSGNHNGLNETNNQINYFFIGSNAIIICNKIYYLQNYDDSIKELINNYFVHRNKNIKKCDKYYCKNCLRSIYDINFNESNKKSFKCPSCLGRCNCSRCVRYEGLIKQIGYYLNNYGDIDKLYNFMVNQNSIFEKLKDFLVLSKFICINFSPRPYINLIDSNYIFENELKPLQLLKYKIDIEKSQNDFLQLYEEEYLKSLLFETQMISIKRNSHNQEQDNNKLIKYLNKKRKNKNHFK